MLLSDIYVIGMIVLSMFLIGGPIISNIIDKKS